MNESIKNPAESWWTCGTEISTKLYQQSMERELLVAVDRVNELHKRIVGPYDNYVCDHCTDLYGDEDAYIEYPCPTIKALDGI